MPDLQSFNKLINNPKFSDVVLIADDDSKFYAHCNIITLNSSYFESALQSHWKHSHTEDDRIKLKPGINSETIKIILDDLYTFSTKGISQGNIGAVFMAADFLGIEPLVDYCQQQVAEDNSIELFKVAYTLDNLSFAQTCVQHFPDLEEIIASSSSLSAPMINFIVAFFMTLGDYEKFECWNLILSWSKLNNGEDLNDSALNLIFEVLSEMRRSFLFFRFDTAEYEKIIEEIVSAADESSLRTKVIHSLKEHKLNGELASARFRLVSKVLSTAHKKSHIHIISELSKCVLKSHKKPIDCNGIVGKGSTPFNVTMEFGNTSVSWKLLFRASEFDFSSSSFHSLCDNKGPTITLVKANGRICAAYNCDSWNSSGGDSSNSQGFIASIFDKSGQYCIERYSYSYSYSDMYGHTTSPGTWNHQNYGPTFGMHNNNNRFDLFIANKCNTTTCSSNLGNRYYANDATPVTLFGSPTFFVEEYEVFGLSF